MIKFFSGTDTFESYTTARTIAEKLAVTNQTEVKIIEADDIKNVSELLQHIEGVGMFSSSNALLIKRLSNNKKLTEYFDDNYDKLKSYDLIVWESQKADNRTGLVKKAKKDGVIFEYEIPKEGEVKNWLMKRFKDKKIEVPLNQISFIVENIGLDKWILSNEIEKISLYLSAKNKTKLSDEELSKILSFDEKGDIWNFLDAFARLDKVKCYKELLKLNLFEDNSQYLITMIARELSLMYQVYSATDNNIDLRELKMHPFVLQKTKDKIKKFTKEKIKFLIKKLFDLDNAIKKGDVSEKIGLSMFVLSI